MFVVDNIKTMTLHVLARKDKIGILNKLTQRSKIKQGYYEKIFRRYILHITSQSDVERKFKDILFKLIKRKKSTMNEVEKYNLVLIREIIDKIYHEFIKINKEQGIEQAINIIFKHYEKNT